jgi:Trk K+ transport system NAD-binding subunit
VALAALLSGARFAIDTTEDDRIDADEMVVETVVLGESSPAVGHRAGEIPFPDDPHAAVLAVISDQTPEIVEHEVDRPFRPGDRVVVAARRQHIVAVARRLTG